MFQRVADSQIIGGHGGREENVCFMRIGRPPACISSLVPPVVSNHTPYLAASGIIVLGVPSPRYPVSFEGSQGVLMPRRGLASPGIAHCALRFKQAGIRRGIGQRGYVAISSEWFSASVVRFGGCLLVSHSSHPHCSGQEGSRLLVGLGGTRAGRLFVCPQVPTGHQGTKAVVVHLPGVLLLPTSSGNRISPLGGGISMGSHS